MSLSGGSILGPYEVVALLGVGGMGEVYRARDSRLNRDVALKVLPGTFANDAQRMARFGREAQVLASLNHSGIAHIYGLEESDGARALVMELAEGETLSARIARGPASSEEALPIARQIAEALEYAHDRGIIHRDLKPANVMVAPNDAVKILDFGLAKALEDSPAAGDISTSPTISMAATRMGMILGTAAYMSPEQARGKAVDRRADIWAFGCVLYEMLSGKLAFSGETVSDTLAAVIRAEPDWSAIPATTPTTVVKLVRRCLTKDPRTRLQAIGEARIAIEDVISGKSLDSAQDAELPSPSGAVELAGWRRWALWAVAIVSALATIALFVIWEPWREPQRPSPMWLTVQTGAPGEITIAAGAAGANPVVISPKGDRFAFVIAEPEGQKLYIRTRDQLKAQELPGTDGAQAPFFSPNGQWIAFFAGKKLKKIAVQGGAVVTLCDAPSNRGGAWGDDDNIYFAASNREGISRVPSAGGTPTSATILDKTKGEITHRYPQVLSGAKAILYQSNNSGENFFQGSIVVQVLKTGERKTVVEGGGFPRYLPDGELVYARDGTLFAAPFSIDRLELTGPPAPFLEHVDMSAGIGYADFSFSEDGTIAYLSGDSAHSSYQIEWMGKDGKYQPMRIVPGEYSHPSVSPDGNRLALGISDKDKGTTDIWVYDIQRDTLSRITFGPGTSADPVWTPDGQRIVFDATPGGVGHRNLSWVRADGTGGIERLAEADADQHTGGWSGDGKKFAYFQRNSEGNLDIWILPFERDAKSGLKPGKPYVFLAAQFQEVEPAISPDGRWVAYQANGTGRYEVFVSPLPGPGGKWQISSGGGVLPVWSPKSNELFFRNEVEPGRIMVAKYRAIGNSFQSDKPEVWSPGGVLLLPSALSFSIAPDGKRFAVLRPAEESSTSAGKNDKFVVLLNGFEALRRIVRQGK